MELFLRALGSPPVDTDAPRPQPAREIPTGSNIPTCGQPRFSQRYSASNALYSKLPQAAV
eukprot:scaffold193473_cov19-Prasinocladus_malaysianus.AAC.1